MHKYAIVAIGYNRPDCLLRLLDSLNAAHISEQIPLIISLDNCGSDIVQKAICDFVWKHGGMRIVTHPRRLGLKNHILSVGDFTKEYENIIVFEDDLFVSPYFFGFVKQAVQAYGDDDRIAGIGLYNNSWEQNSGYAFEAVHDGSDAYFMQYACSWGQVWTRKKWELFLKWYEKNGEPFCCDETVPPNVNRWNEKSWLKYHVKYCAQTQRFFVFPHISLTTNFSAVGSHNKVNDNAYQNAMLLGERTWRLPALEDSHAKYNVYFENLELPKALGLAENEVCLDTYGKRKNSGGKRYWLTTAPAGYKVVKSFALELRPREANVLFDIPGEVIKLYDTAYPEPAKTLSQRRIDNIEMHYITRAVSLKQLWRYAFCAICDRVKQKIKICVKR